MKKGTKTAAIWIGLVVSALFAVTASIKQLSEDASPATGFCQKAERAGYVCVVAPITYDAQVVGVDDGMGTQSTVLIISDGKKIMQVIPLE